MIILEGKSAQVCSPVEGFVEGYCSLGQTFERFVVFDVFNNDKGLNKEKEDNEKAECRKDPFNNDADEDDRGYDYKNDQAADRVKQTLIVKE